MSGSREPIAICGVALRLPGGVNSTDKLWDALREGRDMRKNVPKSRYHREGFDSRLGEKGAIHTQHGYFLEEDPAYFDASLFSLTEQEAQRTDPQQRLLLEVVFECFENGGVVNYRGSEIGTYVGTFGEDWLHSQAKEDQHSGGYILGGQVDLMLANRVSYEFDLRGPSMVIKTGCSASLVALHEACKALQFGECSGALVAGSNLILGPTLTAAMTSEGILSPEGSCKTFSGEADGFARGEAVVAVYLQTMSRALQSGLTIRALITGTGVNANGRSASILQPNMRAQIDLMRKVYTNVGYDPSRTAYVECHGTGTPTGDPIELAAVGTVFGKHGVNIGSLKPNFGHSEGSSGLSSLLKGIVMLERSMIVPNIKFETSKPSFDFHKYNLHVPRRLGPWPRNRDFRISINSFGIGGSNAHVIVEHTFGYMLSRHDIPHPLFPGPQLLLVSAATPSAAQERVKSVNKYAKSRPEVLHRLASTLAYHRQSLQSRTFAVHDPGDDFTPAAVHRTANETPGITMVFSGQGAQWPEMGLDLCLKYGVFMQSVRDMDNALSGLLHPPQWSIFSQIGAPSANSMMHRAEVSQPMCTALQIALVDLLASAGVKPKAVLGHSSGEIAAAYAAGALSRHQAIVIAYCRGLIFQNYPTNGTMAAIGLDIASTGRILRPGVVVACENSHESTTISGDQQTIIDILEAMKAEKKDIMTRKLNVDVAYHSHHLETLGPLYLRLLKQELEPQYNAQRKPLVPMYSSVDVKDTILTATDFTPEYWLKNLLSPVKFNAAMTQTLRASSQNIIVEIGPHTTLSGPMRQICTYLNLPFKYSSPMMRHSNNIKNLLITLGVLFQHGLEMDLRDFVAEEHALVDLDPYPWDRSTKFWYESRLSESWRNRQFGHHELLGLRVPSSTEFDPIWRVRLDVEAVPWLVDHRVNGDVVFPFAGYVSMAGEAFRQVHGAANGYSIRNMEVAIAMVINVEEPVEIVTSLHYCALDCIDPTQHTYRFSISSYSRSTWNKHCTGEVGLPEKLEAHEPVKDKLRRIVQQKSWYAALSRLGLEYGPSFRRVQNLSTSVQNMFAIAEITECPNVRKAAYMVHPTMIDASLQVGLAALTKGLVRNFVRPLVPTHIKRMDVFPSIREFQCVASCSVQDSTISVHGTHPNGAPSLRLEHLELSGLASVDQKTALEDPYGGARLHWVVDPRFQQTSSLIKVPISSAEDRQVIEELALLCVVHSLAVLQELEPNKSHLSKYRAWLEWVAAEAVSGMHPTLSNTERIGELAAEDRRCRIDAIYKRAILSSSMASFAEGIFRVHSNIQDLFTGQTDILELLLRENTLAKIYDTVSFDYSHLVEAYTDQKPNLRILEVGAGTGGSTELILQRLQPIGSYSRYGKYTFTDISAGFFPAARARFESATNMDFVVLDVSQDPLEQGFQLDSYDVIIAANVVHATPCLSHTLHNLQLLLAPGGRLVLTEFCTSFRAPNYIYGHFPGWWLGEADDREWEPYVGVSRWDKELKAAGLSGATDVVLDGPEPSHYCATIISQKPEKTISTGEEILLLCDDYDSSRNQRLAQGFTQNGLTTLAVTLGDELPAKATVVVTHDVTSKLFHDFGEEALHSFQNLCRRLKRQSLVWLVPPFQVNCNDPRRSQALGMLRTARSELDICITTLEVDHDAENLVHHVINVFRETRKNTSDGILLPDYEYAVYRNHIHVGRYRPINLQTDLALQPNLRLDPNASYVLTGGLGGLGKTISVWLAERGAQHLIFLSPHAGTRPQDEQLFRELEGMGCDAIAVQGTVQNDEDVSRAVCNATSPVKGVLHMAMQLRDGPILEMTQNDWDIVVSPKVEGAWNLHRNLPDLDFFVMASSLGTVFQQPGQSNYNAANTFLESFCQYRHSLNLSASVLNICPIEDVGYVADNDQARQKLISQGHWFLDEQALLKFVELSIRQSRPKPDVSPNDYGDQSWLNPSQVIMGLRSQMSLDDPSNHATWRLDRRMGLYHNTVADTDTRNGVERDGLRDFVLRLDKHPSLLSELSSKNLLAMEIGKKIFRFIMRDEAELDPSLKLTDLRLDSLMAIELRRWYKQLLGIEVSVLEILGSGTIEGLGEVAVRALQKKLTRNNAT
ncbi:KR domain-containing protein [Phaeosphaeriaceae sp. SRC1lsM3a]|nr:KR domain-containing protein [Stagonospora sp. SRC1lsM3a]